LLRIRLSRVGKKKQPAYRIVVADSRSPRDGSFLKIIGHYNPLTDPATLVVKEDEAVRWLEKGAQPSDTAAKLLTRIGVMERAGRPPMRYEGKAVPPAPTKEAQVVAAAPAVAEPKAAPTDTKAKPKSEVPEAAAEPEQAEAATEEAPEAPTEAPEAEAEAETPAAEPATEAPEAQEESEAEPEAGVVADAEEEPGAGTEIETKEVEAETEPEATNEEQSQEPAETQE